MEYNQHFARNELLKLELEFPSSTYKEEKKKSALCPTASPGSLNKYGLGFPSVPWVIHTTHLECSSVSDGTVTKNQVITIPMQASPLMCSFRHDVLTQSIVKRGDMLISQSS